VNWILEEDGASQAHRDEVDHEVGDHNQLGSRCNDPE
jgi:hypothetical protein